MKKSLKLVTGKEFFPGDVIILTEYIEAIDEIYEYEGILAYNEKEDQFYLDDTGLQIFVDDNIKLKK